MGYPERHQGLQYAMSKEEILQDILQEFMELQPRQRQEILKELKERENTTLESTMMQENDKINDRKKMDILGNTKVDVNIQGDLGKVMEISDRYEDMEEHRLMLKIQEDLGENMNLNIHCQPPMSTIHHRKHNPQAHKPQGAQQKLKQKEDVVRQVIANIIMVNYLMEARASLMRLIIVLGIGIRIRIELGLEDWRPGLMVFSRSEDRDWRERTQPWSPP